MGEANASLVMGFPNPASDRVLMNGWMPGATLRCFQVSTGKLVWEQRAGGGATEMVVKGWSPGLYEVVGADAEGRQAHWTLNVID